MESEEYWSILVVLEAFERLVNRAPNMDAKSRRAFVAEGHKAVHALDACYARTNA